jgi:hypothetical protein
VAALRGAGLGDLVEGGREGYGIDPSVVVLEVPGAL